MRPVYISSHVWVWPDSLLQWNHLQRFSTPARTHSPHLPDHHHCSLLTLISLHTNQQPGLQNYQHHLLVDVWTVHDWPVPQFPPLIGLKSGTAVSDAGSSLLWPGGGACSCHTHVNTLHSEEQKSGSGCCADHQTPYGSHPNEGRECKNVFKDSSLTGHFRPFQCCSMDWASVEFSYAVL